MEISVGQTIPNATLSYFGSDGVSHIELNDLLKDKKSGNFCSARRFYKHL